MITKEIRRFLIIGTLTVLVDFIAYNFLLLGSSASAVLCKGMSFTAGTAFAYLANKKWTFEHTDHRNGGAWRFAILYCATLGINMLLNSLVLTQLGTNKMSIVLAFLVATISSAILNFVGMKFYVFAHYGKDKP